jgi:hypothetical protein
MRGTSALPGSPAGLSLGLAELAVDPGARIRERLLGLVGVVIRLVVRRLFVGCVIGQ